MNLKAGAIGVALSFLLVCTARAEGIYTWTDANGVKRYSNAQPPEGANNVQTMDELKTSQDNIDKNRQEYDRMVEKASQEADRQFEEQAQQKAKAKESARKSARDEERRKLEQARQKLQEELDAIRGRGLSTTFSAGQKANLIKQVQAKIDQIDRQLKNSANP